MKIGLVAGAVGCFWTIGAFAQMQNGTFNDVTANNFVMGGTTGSSLPVLFNQNCQPAGQATYIGSVFCVRTQSQGFTASGMPYNSEQYPFSFSYKIIPDATDMAAYNAAVSAGQPYVSDKVGMYVGVEGHPAANNAQITQDVWGENWTVYAAPNTTGGYAGLELDMNNDQQDSMGGRSSFGLWLTGGGGFAYKDGIFITGARSPYDYHWHNGVHCGAEISDACVQADSPNSSYPTFALFRGSGYTAYGLSLLDLTQASGGQIALSSAVPLQVSWAAGAATTTYDDTNGLCETNNRTGAQSCLSSGLVVQGNATISGTISAANFAPSSGVFLPFNGANQPALTTASNGDVAIEAAHGSTGLQVGGEGVFTGAISGSASTVTGTSTANTVVSMDSVTIGMGNSNGNHKSVDRTLSAYGQGTMILTPNGLAESATNSIGLIPTGGAVMHGTMMCWAGSDTAGWKFVATYLRINGTLTETGQTLSAEVPATSGASAWIIGVAVDPAGVSPLLAVQGTTSGPNQTDCTAQVELTYVN